MDDRIPSVREDVIDGVTTFWVEAPPPLTVGLNFRVGIWDEPILSRGVTHFVEHLALYPLREVEHGFNGVVTGDLMGFWGIGTEEQLADFFAALGASLRALPIERLATEARILKAEAAARPTGPFDHMLSTLFGPNGPGLGAYPEYGLDLVARAEVQDWADRHCTRENAVLMVAGPSRPDLRIGLPAGEHRPFTLPGPEVGIRPEKLELVNEVDSGVCLGALTPRTAEAVLAWEILGQRTAARLRHELGLVYEVMSAYLPLDGRTAFEGIALAVPEDRSETTAREFLGVINGMRDEGPSQEELDRTRRHNMNADQIDEATLARSELGRVGVTHLLGHPKLSWDELMEERDAATLKTVAQAFRSALSCGAVTGPVLGDRILPLREKRSDEPLAGKRFRPRRGLGFGLKKLIVGPTGLSVRFEGRWITFRWDEISLAERTGFNRWSLLHRRGSRLQIDTDTWRRPGKLTRMLDQGIPAEVLLTQTRRK